MKIKHCLISLLIIITLAFNVHAGGGHDHGHDKHEEAEKGPNGGKLFEKDSFAIEVTIFEDQVPPQYRLYAYYKDKAVKPEEVKAKIELERFGGLHETFDFTAGEDFLTSEKIVEEPHSFEVKLTAKYQEKEYKWEYESFEGRTTLNDKALEVANLTIEQVGPQFINSNVKVYGRLIPNEDKVAHLTARFPGVIKQINKKLGDQVSKGDVLAVVESNQSLQLYEIRSQLNGRIIKRHATIGEFVSEDRELFVVADLSEIWADFQVYRDDFNPIHEGQKVKIDFGNDTEPVLASVSYVSPVVDVATQSRTIRAVLPNLDGKLKPGLFISGILSSTDTQVDLAVKRDAIQSFRDWKVVYLTDGHVFQAIPVELGKTDSEYVEVLSGLKKGDRYVSKNSFIVKADIEKSGASHDH